MRRWCGELTIEVKKGVHLHIIWITPEWMVIAKTKHRIFSINAIKKTLKKKRFVAVWLITSFIFHSYRANWWFTHHLIANSGWQYIPSSVYSELSNICFVDFRWSTIIIHKAQRFEKTFHCIWLQKLCFSVGSRKSIFI